MHLLIFIRQMMSRTTSLGASSASILYIIGSKLGVANGESHLGFWSFYADAENVDSKCEPAPRTHGGPGLLHEQLFLGLSSAPGSTLIKCWLTSHCVDTLPPHSLLGIENRCEFSAFTSPKSNNLLAVWIWDIPSSMDMEYPLQPSTRIYLGQATFRFPKISSKVKMKSWCSLLAPVASSAMRLSAGIKGERKCTGLQGWTVHLWSLTYIGDTQIRGFSSFTPENGKQVVSL